MIFRAFLLAALVSDASAQTETDAPVTVTTVESVRDLKSDHTSLLADAIVRAKL